MNVFDQFIVPTVKFGRCFAEFMIPIALLEEIGIVNQSMWPQYKRKYLSQRIQEDIFDCPN